MAVNLTDYRFTAQRRGWGQGWPSCKGVQTEGTAVVRATRSGVGVSVHRRVARLVGLLVDETERRGYLLRLGECGGYNCRAIAGTDQPSNHSWALAVDLNVPANPFRQPRRTDMPAWMPLLWNRYGFAWGGNYSNDGTTGRADSMHYEFMGSMADADDMTALALHELRGEGPTPIFGKPGKPGKDDPVSSIPIVVQPDGSFRATVMAEAGDGSVVVESAWITFASTWGDSHFLVTALDHTGKTLAQRTFDIANNTSGFLAMPSGSRIATLEGTAKPGAIPAAALISKTR